MIDQNSNGMGWLGIPYGSLPPRDALSSGRFAPTPTTCSLAGLDGSHLAVTWEAPSTEGTSWLPTKRDFLAGICGSPDEIGGSSSKTRFAARNPLYILQEGNVFFKVRQNLTKRGFLHCFCHLQEPLDLYFTVLSKTAVAGCLLDPDLV